MTDKPNGKGGVELREGVWCLDSDGYERCLRFYAWAKVIKWEWKEQ